MRYTDSKFSVMVGSKAYAENWDRIFGKKEPPEETDRGSRPLSAPDLVCLCTCCCLSDDPRDSKDTRAAGYEPFNRRYDCTCNQRWGTIDLALVLFDTMAMRARDLNRPREERDVQLLRERVEALWKDLEK